jgi:hypothetical protein
MSGSLFKISMPFSDMGSVMRTLNIRASLKDWLKALL